MAFRAALLVTLPGLLASASAGDLRILGPDHPRAFFFRSSEGAARNPATDYDRWDAGYSRLDGIIGKCLDEEVPGTAARNPEFFRRFKQRHPEQVVLLHFNGNARDPRWHGGRYFPGHWIHRAATPITRDVPAEPGESLIRVANAADFRVGTGRYRNVNDDIALFGVTPDGLHDWSHCEQVQLLAVDREAGTLRVRRGCYGSRPLAFAAGRARAAAHQVEGPWGEQNHLLWFYNFADHCPRDPQGRSAADVLVDELAGWFGPGGLLAGLDGVEFDVMHHLTRGDTTGDGACDDGLVDGANRYGTGMIGFARRLRARMGPAFIIQGDGALGPGGSRSQRAFRILNGIESEGWPNHDDWEFEDWSGGLNRHRFWQANSHPPAFSYVNHKWVEPVADQPGRTAQPRVPIARHRLALAGAVLTGSAVTYAATPPGGSRLRPAIWDELVAGDAGRTGWLGRARGPAVHLATRQQDLLAGRPLAGRIRGEVVATTDADGLTVRPAAGAHGGDLRFAVTDVPASGPELVVAVKMRGQPPAGWPPEVARLARVGASSGVRPLPPPAPEALGMQLRGRPAAPIDPATGAAVRFRPQIRIGGVPLDGLAVHPPFKGAKGAVSWSRELALDRDCDLRFAIGMGELSPQRSDGVVFRVLVSPLDDGRPGPPEPLFEASTREHRWQRHSLPLHRWTGRRVRLQFVADCGPADDATTDHAFWGAVRLVPTGVADDEHAVPVSRMTWVGSEPFTSIFYFRDLAAPSVDLEFEIEGGSPVVIGTLSAHAGPDTVVREFEHGLVLANPSRHPQAFDLGELFPGAAFRRIRGTQDPETNDGSPVGDALELGPLDAIFLRR